MKKKEISPEKRGTIRVRILKSCVCGGEGAVLDLEATQANHLILFGYAEEISSGESGQKNTDNPQD